MLGVIVLKYIQILLQVKKSKNSYDDQNVNDQEMSKNSNLAYMNKSKINVDQEAYERENDENHFI